MQIYLSMEFIFLTYNNYVFLFIGTLNYSSLIYMHLVLNNN